MNGNYWVRSVSRKLFYTTVLPFCASHIMFRFCISYQKLFPPPSWSLRIILVFFLAVSFRLILLLVLATGSSFPVVVFRFGFQLNPLLQASPYIFFHSILHRPCFSVLNFYIFLHFSHQFLLVEWSFSKLNSSNHVFL